MNPYIVNILFLLSSIGLTHILVYGTIFRKVRKFFKDDFDKDKKYVIPVFNEHVHKMLLCSQCAGFWVGMGLCLLLSPVLFPRDGLAIVGFIRFCLYVIIFMPLYGFASSFSAVLGKSLIDYLNFTASFPLEDESNDESSQENVK